MNDLIRLNVGGTYFSTSRLTLTRYPDSVLAKMFDPEAERDAARRDDTGAFFIDRCPKAFEIILQYLRTGRYYPGNTFDPEALMDEAEYFGLEDLMRNICLSSSLTWFNVGGRRFAINTAILEDSKWGEKCLLRKENMYTNTVDEFGAYVFERDSDLFSAVHHYLTTGKYPNWINQRELRDEARFYRIDKLYFASLEHFAKRFAVRDAQRGIVIGEGVVKPGKSVVITVPYTEVPPIDAWPYYPEKEFEDRIIVGELVPGTHSHASELSWSDCGVAGDNGECILVQHRNIKDKETLWHPVHVSGFPMWQPLQETFWKENQAFVGVENINEKM